MENLPANPDERTALQKNVDRLLDYVFNFYDPATIGSVLEHCGYSPATEVHELVKIVQNEGGAYGPYAVMGAIKMLQNIRREALELSGHLAEITHQSKSDGSVEAMRTVKVTQNVAGYLKKETPDEQLPGEHKLPRAGLLPAGSDVPMVRGRSLQEREGSPDSPGEVSEPPGHTGEADIPEGSEGVEKPRENLPTEAPAEHSD